MFVHDSILDKPEISANGCAGPFLELTLFERQSPYPDRGTPCHVCDDEQMRRFWRGAQKKRTSRKKGKRNRHRPSARAWSGAFF